MLAALGAGAGIEVSAEEGTEIKFVKGVGACAFGDLFRLVLDEIFVGVILADYTVIAQLFQDRVGHDFLVNHFAQLQPIQRQDADHLDQARGKDLLLGDAKVEFGR